MAASIRTKAQSAALLALLVFGLGCGDGGAKPESQVKAGSKSVPRHLLVITIDTWRADRAGFAGDRPSPTPTLDALAGKGTIFTNALSHVPLTLPSHATLFTGRLPFALGVRNNGTYALAPDAETLAERFAAQGFGTGAAVASFVLLAKFGLAQGFATYDDSLPGSELVRGLDTEITADRVYEKWQRWLKARDASKNFLFWAHFYDPHLPYEPPATFASRFPGDPYRAEIAFVDAEIGRMVADLEQAELVADTLIVVTSDHGEGFGEHGEVGHGLLTYQESLHVPLIFTGPGVPAGKTITNRVGLSDLFPTLLDSFGMAVPAGLDGRSLRPLLIGENAESPPLYFESLLGQEDRNWAPITGLIAGDQKLIATPKPELFDLALDPGEKQNRLEDERRRYRELDERLRSLLLASADANRRDADLDDEAKLRSLGYTGGGGGAGRALDPKDGIALDLRLRGVEAALKDGRVEAAREELAAARQATPGYELTAFYLLEHQIEKIAGRAAVATAALERGVARLPMIAALRFELIKDLVANEAWAKGAQASRDLIAIEPEFSQAHLMLGRSLERLGDLAGSRAAFERARQLEPSNTAIAGALADLLMRQGDLPGAWQLRRPLLESGAYDRDPDQLFASAMLCLGLGNAARALTLFEQGLALEPNGFFSLTYALVLARSGRQGEAQAAMRMALDHPNDLTLEQRQLARQFLGI